MGIDDGDSVSDHEVEKSVEAEPEAPLSATKKKKKINDNVEGQSSVSIDPQC